MLMGGGECQTCTDITKQIADASKPIGSSSVTPETAAHLRAPATPPPKPKRRYIRRKFVDGKEVAQDQENADVTIEARMRTMRQQRAEAMTVAEAELTARKLELAVMDDLFAELKLTP